jgi:thiamine-phosphate pyrophosphorylase
MKRLHGLYLITDDRRQGPAALGAVVEAALRGGARVVQYRDKSGDPGRRRAEAAALHALCRRYAVPFLVNDDVELAVAVDADGVHLGRDDQDIDAARRRLGEHRLIGVSCYNRFELAQAAAARGADYAAFGSFHPSPTKPQAVRAQPELLRRARRELALPVVAIGGISPENGAALVHAGADMLAVISAVCAAADIEAAARTFAACFTPAEELSR